MVFLRTEPHPKLPGTIYTAADEISQIGEQNGTGAKGFPVQLDIRDAKAVEEAIEHVSGKLGGLDIVVNNVSNHSCSTVAIGMDSEELTCLILFETGICHQHEANH